MYAYVNSSRSSGSPLLGPSAVFAVCAFVTAVGAGVGLPPVPGLEPTPLYCGGGPRFNVGLGVGLGEGLGLGVGLIVAEPSVSAGVPP